MILPLAYPESGQLASPLGAYGWRYPGGGAAAGGQSPPAPGALAPLGPAAAKPQRRRAPARVPPAQGQRKKAAKGRFQLVEKPLGARGPQCSSQRSRCVGPWGLPGAPLLTGLPPRSSRHWRRSALPSGGFDRIWRHKVNCPEGTREGPLGGVRQIRKKPCVARVSLHSALAAP